MMRMIGNAVLGMLLGAAAPAPAQDDAFPAPPESLQAAQSAGLARLDKQALAQAFSGQRLERNARGELVSAQYQPDGSVEQRIGGSVFDTGTFSITGMSGGSVCLLLVKQMNQRLCAVWFAAADGRHLFGYNPTDGKLRAVSRAAEAK